MDENAKTSSDPVNVEMQGSVRPDWTEFDPHVHAIQKTDALFFQPRDWPQWIDETNDWITSSVGRNNRNKVIGWMLDRVRDPAWKTVRLPSGWFSNMILSGSSPELLGQIVTSGANLNEAFVISDSERPPKVLRGHLDWFRERYSTVALIEPAAACVMTGDTTTLDLLLKRGGKVTVNGMSFPMLAASRWGTFDHNDVELKNILSVLFEDSRCPPRLNLFSQFRNHPLSTVFTLTAMERAGIDRGLSPLSVASKIFRSDQSPLHSGTVNSDVLRWFEDRGLGGAGWLDVVGNVRRTPLASQAMRGHTEAVRNLLAGGADPNAPSGGGIPPLFFAANWSTLLLLLESGANPEICVDMRGRPSERGQNIIDVQRSRLGFAPDWQLDQLDYLLRYRTVSEPIRQTMEIQRIATIRLGEAVKMNDVAAVKQTLKDGANSNGFYGDTKIGVIAVDGRNPEILRALVESGWDPFQPRNNSYRKSEPIIKALFSTRRTRDFEAVVTAVKPAFDRRASSGHSTPDPFEWCWQETWVEDNTLKQFQLLEKVGYMDCRDTNAWNTFIADRGQLQAFRSPRPTLTEWLSKRLPSLDVTKKNRQSATR